METRVKIRRLVVLLAPATIAPAIAGSGVPTWDMRKFCQSRTPSSAVSGCVQLQYAARDRINAKWSRYSNEDKSYCLEYLQNDDIPPSYFRFETCLESPLRGGR